MQRPSALCDKDCTAHYETIDAVRNRVNQFQPTGGGGGQRPAEQRGCLSASGGGGTAAEEKEEENRQWDGLGEGQGKGAQY